MHGLPDTGGNPGSGGGTSLDELLLAVAVLLIASGLAFWKAAGYHSERRTPFS